MAIRAAAELTADEEAKAQRLADVAVAPRPACGVANGLMVGVEEEPALFGQTEFPVQEGAHWMGAAAFETALRERKNEVRRVERLTQIALLDT